MTDEGAVFDTPTSLVAELTHRCLLGCPYCSNPLALEPSEGELDVATWSRVFQEAAALGVPEVRLSGGEPGARCDLVDIAANAHEAGLRASLITSGVGIATRTLHDLWEAGLDHVEVSFQDSDAVSADRIAGHRGAFQRKHALTAQAVRIGLPLTVSAVVHSANLGRTSDLVALAIALKADRIELVHVQYHGWALKNRRALMPTADQVERAMVEIETLRQRHRGKIVIDAVLPDDCANPPASFIGDWNRRPLHVTPSGSVFPCYPARRIPGLDVWNVQNHSLGDIWAKSPAFNALREAAILPAPGATCPARRLSPHHASVVELATRENESYVYRGS